MDADGSAWQRADVDDLDLDLGEGGDLPPTDVPGREGGPGGGRGAGGRRVRVWPWIAGLVALLGLERVVVLGVIQLGEAWIWWFAGLGLVGSAAIIAVGGTAFARLR